MKTSLLAFSLLALAITSACDRRDAPENSPTPETAAADATPTVGSDPTTGAPVEANADSAPPAASATDDDALALGLLAAVDDHEIQAAQQAKSKKVSAAVMDYANMMEKQHTDNLVETKALGSLADTPEVQAMKEKGASDLAELGKLSGKEYETAYVDAMVKGHTEALALIDGRLLTLASLGPVRDHLAKTREAVAMHLEAARKLQGTPPA